MAEKYSFESLIGLLSRVPAIEQPITTGELEEGGWSVHFSIDIHHDLAWSVVQEIGHILNYLSVSERLPTVFMPISPPPYMNGGPDEFLSWVIECHEPEFSPAKIAEWLEARLPQPVDEESEWNYEGEEDEDDEE